MGSNSRCPAEVSHDQQPRAENLIPELRISYLKVNLHHQQEAANRPLPICTRRMENRLPPGAASGFPLVLVPV